MKFDDFIQCCVMLKSLTESFKRLDTNRSGVITINYETVSFSMEILALNNIMRTVITRLVQYTLVTIYCQGVCWELGKDYCTNP